MPTNPKFLSPHHSQNITFEPLIKIALKNEKLTRKEIIDHRLKKADWIVTDRTQVIEEFDILFTVVEEPPTPYAGHQFSDYVLLGKDGKPLAVVEAKKTSVDDAIGREQAKQYCFNIQGTQGGELPFCFYTNGHDIFYWDLNNYPPKKVFGGRWSRKRRPFLETCTITYIALPQRYRRKAMG